MKFIKGTEYGLFYSETHPSRRWRCSGRVSEWMDHEYIGMYEYIGSRGGKLHFYDNKAGRDVLLGKAEAIKAHSNWNERQK